MEAHGLGVLDGEVAEAANAGDDDPVAGLGFGGLEALVDRDASADDGCYVDEAYVLGEVGDVVGIGYGVLGVATVFGVATELCLGAAGLLAGEAVDALAAGGVEPDDADAVAFLDGLDVFADAGDEAYAFVAGDEGRCGLDGPVAFAAAWRSVWQTPQASILIWISSGPGSGMGISWMTRGLPNSRTTAAFIVFAISNSFRVAEVGGG